MYFHKTPALIKRLFPALTWQKTVSHDPQVFLTFDDGPVPDITEYVISELQRVGAKATFFCVGQNIEDHPALFERIIKSGHGWGNHTYNHLNGWKTDLHTYLANVEKCRQMFDIMGARQPYNLFRPPYGLLTFRQIREISNRYEIVMWDILSGDFDVNLNCEKSLKKMIKHTQNGSIVVFHDSYKTERNLKYILPRYLHYLAERDFTFSVL